MSIPMHLSNTMNAAQKADSVDSLSVMIEQESTKVYSCRDYLNSNNKTNKSSRHRRRRADNYQITLDDRFNLVEWCYQIVDNCQFDRERVACAMNIAERYMSTSGGRDILYHRGNYQLVIMTSLYISIKIHEPLSFGSEDFSSLSNGMYSVEQIEDMEWQILEGLNWRVSCPTSLQVAHTILQLMASNKVVQEQELALKQKVWEAILEEVAFQTEIALRDYYFTAKRPSTIAAAAVLNAIEQINDRDYTVLLVALTSILREFNFENTHQVMEAMDKLSSLVKDNSEEEELSVNDDVPSNNTVELSNSSASRIQQDERRSNQEEVDEIATIVTSRTAKYSHQGSFTDVQDDIYQR